MSSASLAAPPCNHSICCSFFKNEGEIFRLFLDQVFLGPGFQNTPSKIFLTVPCVPSGAGTAAPSGAGYCRFALGEHVMLQPVYTNPVSSVSYCATRRHRYFMCRGWKRDREEGPRPYDRPEVVQTIRDMQTAYGSWKAPHALQPSFGGGVPASGFRQNRYLGPTWDADGNSAHRHDWYKSTA